MLPTQHPFAGREGLLVQPLRFRVPPLHLIQIRQIVDRAERVGMLSAQHSFANS